jgi:hypothetical protein
MIAVWISVFVYISITFATPIIAAIIAILAEAMIFIIGLLILELLG